MRNQEAWNCPLLGKKYGCSSRSTVPWVRHAEYVPSLNIYNCCLISGRRTHSNLLVFLPSSIILSREYRLNFRNFRAYSDTDKSPWTSCANFIFFRCQKCSGRYSTLKAVKNYFQVIGVDGVDCLSCHQHPTSLTSIYVISTTFCSGITPSIAKVFSVSANSI